MTKLIKKIVIFITIGVLVVPIQLLNISDQAIAAEDQFNESFESDPEYYVDTDTDLSVGGTDFGWNFEPEAVVPTPTSLTPVDNFFDSNFNSDTGEADGLLWAAENILSSPKIVLNSSDEQDIRIAYCLGSVIPDFANDPEALALELNRDYGEILRTQMEDQEAYASLVKDAQRSARTKITGNLRNDLTNFACIAGVDEARAAEMLATDDDSVNEIIRYANEDVVIDRRILELLVNLVTPKDQGGAGHERIKIFRIRRNYNREARMYSQESDAIREMIAEQTTTNPDEGIETIEELSTADGDEILDDPTFSQAEALGAIVDSNGSRGEGDLIFIGEEDNANISAHFKGQAVDISEVDTIKCTLIKKKRIGSDTKIKQPATPIKLLWQTNEGYSRDEAAINDGINSQLRSIASGELIDLLDEFGVALDDDSDLSDANLTDILEMVGSSLISEVLNSPTNSLNGFDFSDTIKKIGALIIADKLDLPRSAFWESDFDNIDELKTSIGEAVFEKNLDLPYWSVRGDNLSDVLTNIGVRKMETELHLSAGSLNANQTSQTELRLSSGRRAIEDSLYLQAGIFQSDTTYSRLREIAGQRKIDLIFANPSTVDDRLDITIGTANRYKNGDLPPDEFANLIGTKLLADNAFIHQYMAANTNAINATTVSTDLSRTQNTQIVADILSGNNNSESYITNYQQIGIHTLARAINNNADIQEATINWLSFNVSDGNCGIESEIYGSIVRDNTSVRVTIPEDQFMSTAEVRRGDLSRLFGCENVAISSVFSRTGEKALTDALINSDLAQQAQQRFLSDHPEIQELIADIEFYRERIENIQSLSQSIRETVDSLPGDLDGRTELSGIINSIIARASAIDRNNLNLSNIRGFVRETGNESDSLYQTANRMIASANQNVIDNINEVLSDAYEIAHNIDEIFAGEPQPRIRTLSIEQVEQINSSSRNSGLATNTPQIDIGVLSMVLSGRMAPSELFVSLGSSQVENSLDLPTNSILYFAKYVSNQSRDKNRDKNVFFQSIGQSAVEETLNMPSFFFQGAASGDDASLIEIRNHIANSYGISQAEAGARIMQAFGLSGNFSSPARSANFISRTEDIDRRLGVKIGSTGQFLRDQLILSLDLTSNTDTQMVAAILGISEYTIKRFISVKNGERSLDDVNNTDATANIYYSNGNHFSKQPGTNTDGTCPLAYSLRDGIMVADGVINSGSYNYVDSTGQHSFPTIDQARRYSTNNESQRVTFLDELASAIAARMREASSDITKEAIESRLSDFLRNPNADRLFSNEELTQINSGNIDSPDEDPEYLPNDVTNALFSRKLSNNVASDYKGAVGKAVAEKRVIRALFSGLSIDVAGMNIDAGDIFDILSGNGVEVLYRIGGRYLERELDLPADVLRGIVEAGSADLRSCSLADVGGSLLGSLIDLPGLSLEGNIYDNVGTASIEQSLGLPARSFHGNTLEEIIDNVGPVNFAIAFNLPFTRYLSPYTIEVILDDSSATNFKHLTLEKQHEAIKRAIEHPDSAQISDSELSAVSADVKNKVTDEMKKLIEDSSNWNYTNNPHTMSDVDKNRVISAVNRIDSELGVPPGTTRRFLTKEITPSAFRQEVAETSLTSLAAAEIIQLFDGDMDQSEARSMMTSLIGDIRSRDPNAWRNVAVTVAGFLGRKFDVKLGIDPGTFTRMLQDPSQTSVVAIEIGLQKLDESLDIDPTSRRSFSWLYSVYEDYSNGNTTEYENCRLGDEYCFQRLDEPDSQSRRSIRDFQNFVQNNWQAIIISMTEDIVGRYIEEYRIPISADDYDLATRDILGFIQGDTSFLEIAMAVAGATAVNSIGDDAQDLPGVFRITYADIHFAIRGDSDYQARYATRAEQSIISEAIAGENYGPRPPDLGILTLIPGVDRALGITPPAVAAPPVDYSGYEYDTNLHQQNRMEEFGIENPIAPEVVDVDDDTYERNRDEVFGNPDAPEIVRDSREQAAARQRTEALQNLSYRMADGQLWRLDNSIPPGFTEVMLTGNGHQRTQMLYEYLRNGMARGKIAGIDLPDWTQGVDLIGIAQFIQNPNAENLANIASSGALGRIDTMLSDEFSDFLGFDLQPGTISALFTGAVTGDFVNNQTIAGVEFRSVTQIYSDWATQKLTGFVDKFLDLPPGTSYQVLTMYQEMSALRASLLAPGADMTKIRADIATMRAELISFVITTVFSEQIGQAEEAIGLVPGTGGMLVGMAVSYLLGAAVNPAVIAIFVIQNLFGVYKQVLVCTADGYYPGIESEPDPSVVDFAGLGKFNGRNQKLVKENYIKAAQYKARTLAGDALMLSERIGDELAIPSQIMVGRQEDVDYWNYKIDEVICSKIGGCAGTRAGMWKNPQTTFYTHIGF